MKGLMAPAVCIALICHSAAAAEPAAAEPKWLQDANGCKFLSPAPARSLGAISWTGQCVEGFVSGPGEVRIAQWMSFRGEFAQGRLVKGVMEYVGRESYESEAFLDNRLNGNTVVRTLDGTTIQAQYDHGALKSEHAEILWPSGARYRGPLDPGSRLSQGKGTLDYPDGSVYEGEFKQGRLTGTGVMKYASGEIRSGTFIDGALNGHGSIVYADRSRYEGELRMGEPDGYGRIELADGDSYEGTFMAGRSHGKGKATYADGGVYEGDWVAGDPHGSGTRTFANGNRYVGQFVSGKKNGQGLFTQASGETYEGEWRGDQLNGKCRIVINQSIYQGECRDSKASGTGHLEDKSKDLVYEGEFDQDQFQGKGSLHIGDLAYDGMFKAGAMEGPGTLSVGKLTMRGDFKSGVLAHGTITGADGRTFEVDIEKNEIFEVSEDGTKHPIDQLPPDITI
jgi:hypothetical protein